MAKKKTKAEADDITTEEVKPEVEEPKAEDALPNDKAEESKPKEKAEEPKPEPVKKPEPKPEPKAEEPKAEPEPVKEPEKKPEPKVESKPKEKAEESYRLYCPLCNNGAKIVSSTFRAYFAKCVKCSHSFKLGRELGFPSQGV